MKKYLKSCVSVVISVWLKYNSELFNGKESEGSKYIWTGGTALGPRLVRRKTTQGSEGIVVKDTPFWSVLTHIFKTSGWNNITFGSQGDIGIIHSFSDFDLGMTPCDLDLFLVGVGLQQEDHLPSN